MPSPGGKSGDFAKRKSHFMLILLNEVQNSTVLKNAGSSISLWQKWQTHQVLLCKSIYAALDITNGGNRITVDFCFSINCKLISSQETKITMPW